MFGEQLEVLLQVIIVLDVFGGSFANIFVGLRHYDLILAIDSLGYFSNFTTFLDQVFHRLSRSLTLLEERILAQGQSALFLAGTEALLTVPGAL